MRGIYSAFIKNKDHFLIFFSVFISVTLLLSTEDPRMRFIRAKAADFTAFISSPINWIGFLKDVEEQTRVATGGTATDGYQMLDFSMTKAFRMDGAPTLNVSIFGKNLLNEVARNHTSFVKNEVPLPGRNYGLKFNVEI